MEGTGDNTKVRAGDEVMRTKRPQAEQPFPPLNGWWFRNFIFSGRAAITLRGGSQESREARFSPSP